MVVSITRHRNESASSESPTNPIRKKSTESSPNMNTPLYSNLKSAGSGLRNDLRKMVLQAATNLKDTRNEETKKRKKSPNTMYKWSWLSRAGSQLWDMDSFDPFQVFEVSYESCCVLQIQVIRGERVSKGWIQDMMDTPDPYVVLFCQNTPNGKKRTKQVDNNVNPHWNETFEFYLNPEKLDVILEITLMDANYTLDEELGKETVKIKDLILDKEKDVTVVFNNVSKVYLKLKLTKDTNPDLRYSLALCDSEKQFLRERRKRVFWSLKKLLGSKSPRHVRQVPVVAILGSGGGIRAFTCFSGVMKALSDTGILDCAFYTTGLSGSSWYLSTLYSHPDYPKKSPGELLPQFRASIGHHWLSNLTPVGMYRYASFLTKKSMGGQPVSFTDFFGCLLRDLLLGAQPNVKLTDMRRVVDGGLAALPLCTCLHVKENVSARVFQEWLEFSPYEIGIAKYGTFMKTEHFGSKFFLGRLVREYPESPLHYLQGIWGSAFCILFKRLVQENGKKDLAEMMRDVASEEANREAIAAAETMGPVSASNKFANVAALKMMAVRRREDEIDELRVMEEKHVATNTDAGDFIYSSDEEVESRSDEEDTDSPAKDEVDLRKSSLTDLSAQFHRALRNSRKLSTEESRRNNKKRDSKHEPLGRRMAVKLSKPNLLEPSNASPLERKPTWKQRRATRQQSKEEKHKGLLANMLSSVFSSSWLDTRAGRAGLIFNPLRGLSLSELYPLSPFTPNPENDDSDDFKRNHEALDPHTKKLYMVDSGLTFNSPFPLVLRPQRGVDVFLSFDFSARPQDDDPPFKELLLAEKWAGLNNIPFPPIAEQAKKFSEQPNQEVYVFRHPIDPHCPVILHFALINTTFRKYKAPGVPRETKEELEFADFEIFTNPNSPYSLYNFCYSEKQYDRLAQLCEFNTLLSLPTIKEELIQAVKRKQRVSSEIAPVNMADIAKLKFTSTNAANKFKEFIKRVNSTQSTGSEDIEENDKSDLSDHDDFYDALDLDRNEPVTDL